MKDFTYVIRDSIGIHARPAGLLVKKASEFESEISLEVKEKTADAKKIFSVMGLGAKNGDSIKVTISGKDEDEASLELQKFFEENL